MISPEAYVASLTAIAIALSQGRTVEEIAIMASIFNSLGGTLESITFIKGLEEGDIVLDGSDLVLDNVE